MKQSSSTSASKDSIKTLYSQFYRIRQNFEQNKSNVLSKKVLNQISNHISSNVSLKCKQLPQRKNISFQNLDPLIQQNNQLKRFSQDRISSKSKFHNVSSLKINQQSQVNEWKGQFTFNKQFRQTQQCETVDYNLSPRNMVISDSFRGSFRAALSSYVELYFQKISITLMLKKKHCQILKLLIGIVQNKLQPTSRQIQIDHLSLAIYRVVKRSDQIYRISDIKKSLRKVFGSKKIITKKDFSFIFEIKQFQSYLANPSQCLIEKDFNELIQIFFQIFIQFYDTQTKLKQICKSNQQKLIKLIVQLSINQDLNLKIMAQFLYFQVNKSKKWLILRFQQFFAQKFGTKNKSISFLKWVKEMF